ncbi:hypothetical protein BDU57DRAFT_577654 [Ampelomyces quisqualis]|uniref:Uncharacterized protein n=1 Tax=Ampelomyces quisqualis TaxID=50730 RepID=A0A6A5QF69_AMPQU|nr:hypothetical protein BDU57DRAFT_577654 [Ampelomyces quisqualis]
MLTANAHLYPRIKACHHTIHPALGLYNNPKCPSCHMDIAIYDVMRSQQVIMPHGGIEEWEELSRESVKTTKVWRDTTRGSRSQPIDIHGNNSSHRSSKARLYNVVMELEDLAVLEQAWEIGLQVDHGSPGEDYKTVRMQYSATNAIARYKAAIEQDTLREVEKSSATFGHKRGREREIAARPDYPPSDDEDDWDPDRHRVFESNEAQRDFLDANLVLDDDDHHHHLASPPKRKRRRQNAKVSLHNLVYVRDEADVDELRHQVPSGDSGTRHGLSLPVLKPPPILRTSRFVRNPRPHRSYYTLDLKTSDGSKRKSCHWKRQSTRYSPGRWAVPAESENVDTSGHCYRSESGWFQWEVRVILSQVEAEKMDREADNEGESDSEMSETDDEVLDQDGMELKADEQGLNSNTDDLQIPDLEKLDQEAEIDDSEQKVALTGAPFPPAVMVKGLAKAIKQFPRAWQID